MDKYKFGINENSKIKIRINFETIEDITKIINESIIEIFKDFKKVRIFINPELKKIPETSVDIKKEIKEIYDNLLDQFLESGKIKGDDLDENLRAILLGNALEKHNYDSPNMSFYSYRICPIYF